MTTKYFIIYPYIAPTTTTTTMMMMMMMIMIPTTTTTTTTTKVKTTRNVTPQALYVPYAGLLVGRASPQAVLLWGTR